MTTADPLSLLDIVRRVARRKPSPATIVDWLGDGDRDWRVAEATLEAEIFRAPRSARRLVDCEAQLVP